MDTKVCVITGGGSGMGLAAAKFMTGKKVVISGRTVSKLEKAVAELKEAGIDTVAHACDTSDRNSVKELAAFAASLGTITTVINSAGMSPTMAGPEKLLRVNALGTVYMNEEFSKLMGQGSVIEDIASNSAYSLPKILIPKKAYPLAMTNEDEFLKKTIKRASIAKDEYGKAGFAYAISKNFVVWYAQYSAFKLGPKGIRVVSLSPGLIDTGMGEAEKEHGGYLLKFAAEHRMGTPEELGFAIASVADERNGYLAGVDVLTDGGATYGKDFLKLLGSK